jgi:hypothetical protein
MGAKIAPKEAKLFKNEKNVWVPSFRETNIPQVVLFPKMWMRHGCLHATFSMIKGAVYWHAHLSVSDQAWKEFSLLFMQSLSSCCNKALC